MNRANRRDRRTRTDDRTTRTDRDTRRDRTHDPITDGSTMAEVSHTHPHADRGAVVDPFRRGPIVAADGGERNAVSRTSEDERSESSGRERDASDDEESETREPRMKDVDHEPPFGDGVDRVFERGGKEEPVESEE